MQLENLDNKDYWICEYCDIGFLANPKKDCEHNDITFGVNNLAFCNDCGNLIAYENKLNISGFSHENNRVL